jgi:hypothetical protein
LVSATNWPDPATFSANSFGYRRLSQLSRRRTKTRFPQAQHSANAFKFLDFPEKTIAVETFSPPEVSNMVGLSCMMKESDGN